MIKDLMAIIKMFLIMILAMIKKNNMSDFNENDDCKNDNENNDSRYNGFIKSYK